MDHPVLSRAYENQIVLSGSDCCPDVAEFFKGRKCCNPHKHDILAYALNELRQTAINTNVLWASKLGINPATAITCVKPSGTVSQLVDSSSGIHPRHAPEYIRTVRQDVKDPLCRLMIDAGVSNEPDVTKPDDTTIFSFPITAPEGSIYRDDRTAIEQLELWKIYQLHWCEHKPSITVYVKEEEWFGVFAWVWDNFDILSGVSFLPHSDHNYKQAPYQVDPEMFEHLSNNVVDIPWDKLPEYETEDETTGMKEYACSGGSCEIL